MAQAMAQSAATTTAIPSVARSSKLQRPVSRTARVVAPRTVSNAKQHSQMQVWSPFGNRFFETFSYLPPLSDTEISKQVDYIVGSGWVPTLEFQQKDQAYAGTEFSRLSQPGHYSNRYWTMWKLPMFGCTDPGQVLTEIKNCEGAFPDSYIRLVAFDSVRQVQITGFLVHRPPGTKDYLAPDARSLS